MKRCKNLLQIYIPLLFACLIAMVLSIGVIPSQSAQAKVGPISIRSVYTTDENQNNKTDFAPGDKINYHVDVDNNSGGQIPVDVRFQAFPNDNSPDPRLYSYDKTEHVDQMPVGLSRFYTPVSIPEDAVAHEYAVRITVTPSNSGSPANDEDWGESNFTIKESSSTSGEDDCSVMRHTSPATTTTTSNTRYPGYCYGYEVNEEGKHWYVEFDVGKGNAHKYTWHATGPRGNCDDPNIKNLYIVGKPYCSVENWGAVNDMPDDNLVRAGISLPDQIYPGQMYGPPSNFILYS